MSAWTIDAVKTGELRDVPADLVFHGDDTGRLVAMPLVMFVLRSGDRTIVVDTGGPADEESVRRVIPFGYVVEEGERVEQGLDRLGVRPGDVDLVVNTHLHWDHCSNNAAFPAAEILVQRAELTHAAAPCTGHHGAYGIHPGTVPPFALCLDRVRALDGAAEIAPGVGVVPLPGHSPGSQGVHVRTAEGTYVITGDCVDTLENWENGGADHARPSGRFTDLAAYEASLALLRATGWRPLPSHDPAVVAAARFGYC
jgi:N-acyl homoserine lactone hydrolase